MSNWVLIADELPATTGSGITAWLDGAEWAIFRDGEEWFAVSGRCPHKGAPLVDGTVEDGCVTCPWHGWKFDSHTGDCVDHRGFHVQRAAVRVDADRRAWIDQPPPEPVIETKPAAAVDTSQYHLVRYSRLGWVGIFSTAEAVSCQLREQVIVETTRGVELGEFLGAARLADAAQKKAGALLRAASAIDVSQQAANATLLSQLIQAACESAIRMQLPIEIVDGEVLCEGGIAILYYLGEFVPDFAVLRTELALQYGLNRIDLVSFLEPEASSGCGTSCGEGGCGH